MEGIIIWIIFFASCASVTPLPHQLMDSPTVLRNRPVLMADQTSTLTVKDVNFAETIRSDITEGNETLTTPVILPPEQKPEEDNLALIVSVSVCVPVALIAFLVACCCLRRKKKCCFSEAKETTANTGPRNNRVQKTDSLQLNKNRANRDQTEGGPSQQTTNPVPRTDYSTSDRQNQAGRQPEVRFATTKTIDSENQSTFHQKAITPTNKVRAGERQNREQGQPTSRKQTPGQNPDRDISDNRRDQKEVGDRTHPRNSDHVQPSAIRKEVLREKGKLHEEDVNRGNKKSPAPAGPRLNYAAVHDQKNSPDKSEVGKKPASGGHSGTKQPPSSGQKSKHSRPTPKGDKDDSPDQSPTAERGMNYPMSMSDLQKDEETSHKEGYLNEEPSKRSSRGSKYPMVVPVHHEDEETSDKEGYLNEEPSKRSSPGPKYPTVVPVHHEDVSDYKKDSDKENSLKDDESRHSGRWSSYPMPVDYHHEDLSHDISSYEGDDQDY